MLGYFDDFFRKMFYLPQRRTKDVTKEHEVIKYFENNFVRLGDILCVT